MKKIFISYASLDKALCERLIKILQSGYDVWSDQRIIAGTPWWNEIIKRLNWCEVFIFLISPNSIKSVYTRREFVIARKKNKIIIPIIIKAVDKTPKDLLVYQYIDMCEGLTPENTAQLLLSIERNIRDSELTYALPSLEDDPEIGMDPTHFVDEGAKALQQGDCDSAVYWLQKAKEKNVRMQFIDVDQMLREAMECRDKQITEQAIADEYAVIVAMVQRASTHEQGCVAFRNFREHYPDYDPKNLSAQCLKSDVPDIDWCRVTAGEVTIEYDSKRVIHYVNALRISKYPITNQQFQMFVEAADGYVDGCWWNFSDEASEWRRHYTTALGQRITEVDHPRVYISWYEAMAFCQWLSYKKNMTISLATEPQWQRAAQADSNSLYPWGRQFDSKRCNSVASGIRRTTPVTQFADSASPFGVVDMSGNVWEWTTTQRRDIQLDEQGHDIVEMVVKGGSYSSPAKRVRCSHRIYLKRDVRFSSIGFRIVTLADEAQSPRHHHIQRI